MGAMGRRHNGKPPEYITAYTIYKNEVHTLTLRKTKKRYIADERTEGFGYRTRFDRSEFSLSREEAIQKAVTTNENYIGYLKVEMEKCLQVRETLLLLKE